MAEDIATGLQRLNGWPDGGSHAMNDSPQKRASRKSWAIARVGAIPGALSQPFAALGALMSPRSAGVPWKCATDRPRHRRRRSGQVKRYFMAFSCRVVLGGRSLRCY